MIVLGIETATQLCGVGLVGPDGLIADYKVQKKNIHAEYLPSAIKNMLDGAGLSYTELEGIAVSIGPGSFTGLRIGLGVAKGLAFGWDLPIAAIPTMDALVDQVPGGIADQVCVLLTARKVEAYQGLYQRVNGSWELQSDVKTVHVDEIGKDLPQGDLLFTGEGAGQFREIIMERVDRAIFLPRDGFIASGFAVAEMGRRRLESGVKDDLDQLVPYYIKRFQGVA